MLKPHTFLDSNDVEQPLGVSKLQQQMGDISPPDVSQQSSTPSVPQPSDTSQVIFQRVGIHSSFITYFPNRASLTTIKEFQLPHIPLCPGPYLLPDADVLPRPAPSLQFLTDFPREAQLYSLVRKGGRPNYRGAQVPISSLPLDMWQDRLRDCEDTQLVSFMRFGWPVGFEGQKPPDLFSDNHGSARRRPEHIANYVATELKHGALAGPFQHPPFLG